ncbi:AHH domain-containing protein [Lihuaxuella thermophila]|uniref:AHH domain-containing protein n=1 Tax=Lihuaxuella thermophila TaxID=1173111 RepID=UPI0031393CC8
MFPGYFEENLFPVRMSVSHAVATALVALAIGSAVRLRSKTGSVSYSIPFFFFLWCFLDHSALNSFDKFDEWVYEIHDWIGNGYYTKPVFLLFLLIAIIYDYIKLNSIRTKLPLLEREYVIEPVREFFDLFFSLLGDRKRYKYLLVFYRDRRELGFRYLYGNPGDYTEIEKLKIRTAEFQKQLAVMLTLLLILSVSLSGAVVSMIQAVHDPACLACVFEDIGDWWNGLDTVDQLMIIGSLIALSLLFTGPWGAITFGLAAGDVLGMAGEFGTFLRNPRAWLAGLARMGPQEALAFGIEAGLSRIPEVRIGKKIGNKLEDYIYRLVRDSSGNILRGQSSTLATRLKQAGEPKPRPWYAAHHIVPGNESFNADAVAARRIFDRLMLDPSRTYTHLDDPINAAINGVWLPQRRGIGTEAYHPEIHTDVYYAELHRRLRAVTSKEELIDVLQEIKEELQQNIFPY